MEKILVIEDSTDVRRNIVELLELAGFNLAEASDGLEALEIVKKFKPDLVISDIMMPRMDGYSLLREFQNDSSTSLIPFIFLSAKTDIQDIRKGMNRGADDYLLKPFKANELLQAVKTRLDKKKKVDQILNETAMNISMYVPHELRTPLVSILGFTDILMEDFDSIGRNEILEILEKIKKSGHRLHQTIEKFLVFTELELLQKDENEKLTVARSKTTNPADIIEKTAVEKAQFNGRLHDLKLKLVNADVRIEEIHLKIIIEELLENALKFSPSGSIIKIETLIEDNYYKIIITDNGIGMNEDQISRISPFIQFKRDLFDRKGNGLGLVIIKKLSSIYNGSVSIKSKMNDYTSVEIGLPMW